MRILAILAISDDKSGPVAGTDESSNFDLYRDFIKVVDFVEFISQLGFAEYSIP